MKNKFLLLAAVLLSAACNRRPDDLKEKREMLDVGEQKVITSYANPKQGTMSILFGNTAAIQAASDSTGKHQPGETYTLATWKQVGNPRWYGSYLSGKLKSLEILNIASSKGNGIVKAYQLAKGAAPCDVDGKPIDQEGRIDIILHLKPSVFP